MTQTTIFQLVIGEADGWLSSKLLAVALALIGVETINMTLHPRTLLRPIEYYHS